MGDLLGDALRALRVEGSLLLRESYLPPFSVQVPSTEDLGRALGVGPTARVVAFHLAEKGSFEIRRPGRAALVVEAGEMVLGFGGEPHRLAAGEGAHEVHFRDLLPDATDSLYGPAPTGAATAVRIDCGALVFHDTQLNPLFGALPDMLHLETGPEDRLRRVTDLLRAEIARHDPAAEYVVERLLEIVCAEGVRAHAAERETAPGWFRGLADPVIARALEALHRRPGEPWTVARLAERVHLSGSRFAARFRAAVGIGVMTYVTRWRMHLAMERLAHDGESLSEIAHRLGYESLPAFSRAFKRHVGTPPAAFRRQRRGGVGIGDGFSGRSRDGLLEADDKAP